MFALAARRLGYRVHTLSPDRESPTGQVADRESVASYEDLDAVRLFAASVQVVTFEFENVPAATAAAAAEHTLVRPAGSVLHTTQNRLREKNFLATHGFPVAPFAAVRSLAELEAAAKTIGLPAVLKTAGWGYDGKGQAVLRSFDDAPRAWAALASDAPSPEAILEAFVDFACEVSVVAARGGDGSYADWGLFENQHRGHVLDLTLWPARISEDVARRAREIARGVLEALNVVGVLCVEMFVARDGALFVNELAPRPHNSGHLTIEASVTSQFEQQVRAVCGLPLGSTELLRPAAMANLLGDLWANGEPRWNRALQDPNVKLHLYGKTDARPGRKMGHLTALGIDPEDAAARVLAARERMGGAAITQGAPERSGGPS